MEKKNTSPTKSDWKRIFNNTVILRQMPFLLFLAGLTVGYIYNGHHADKLAKKIAISEKSIKELQYEYKSAQSEVIFRSKASELMKAVEPMGLKELSTKPILLENEAE